MAEDLFNRGLCLPSGTAMTEEELDSVIEVILGNKRTDVTVGYENDERVD